jgi:hypothetical protein
MDVVNAQLLTGTDCPYYNSPGGRAFTLQFQNGVVSGFLFQGELYSVGGLGGHPEDMVLGNYQRLPVQNAWHPGTIERVSSGLRWRNAAGVVWALSMDVVNAQLLTGTDCPYYNSPGGRAFTLQFKNGVISGFLFQGELYSVGGVGGS